MRLLDLDWQPREPPLAADALLAPAAAAGALLARLLAPEAEARLPRLRGLRLEEGALLILGEYADLPWAEGARYFGTAPAAPELLLPTTQAPAISEELLLAALRRLLPAGPLLYCPRERLLVPLAGARRLERERLMELIAES